MRTLLLLVLLVADPAAAQRLTASPDTLHFDGATERFLVLRNETVAPVAFDSLRFDMYSPELVFAVWIINWRIDNGNGSWTDGGYQCFLATNPFRQGLALGEAGRCVGSLDGRVIAPGEEVEFSMRMDCPCRTGAPHRKGGFDDVAEFFSGGHPEPQRVPFLNALPIAEEDAPAGGHLRIGAAVPNPSRGAVVLDVTLGEPAVVSVDVADTLGRVVRREPPRERSAGTKAIPLDLAGLPPGVYVARVVAEWSGGIEVSAQRFTIAR